MLRGWVCFVEGVLCRGVVCSELASAVAFASSLVYYGGWHPRCPITATFWLYFPIINRHLTGLDGVLDV